MAESFLLWLPGHLNHCIWSTIASEDGPCNWIRDSSTIAAKELPTINHCINIDKGTVPLYSTILAKPFPADGAPQPLYLRTGLLNHSIATEDGCSSTIAAEKLPTANHCIYQHRQGYNTYVQCCTFFWPNHFSLTGLIQPLYRWNTIINTAIALISYSINHCSDSLYTYSITSRRPSFVQFQRFRVSVHCEKQAPEHRTTSIMYQYLSSISHFINNIKSRVGAV